MGPRGVSGLSRFHRRCFNSGSNCPRIRGAGRAVFQRSNERVAAVHRKRADARLRLGARPWAALRGCKVNSGFAACFGRGERELPSSVESRRPNHGRVVQHRRPCLREHVPTELRGSVEFPTPLHLLPEELDRSALRPMLAILPRRRAPLVILGAHGASDGNSAPVERPGALRDGSVDRSLPAGPAGPRR